MAGFILPLSDQCASHGLQGAGGCTCSCPGPQRVPGDPLAIYSDNSSQTGHGQKKKIHDKNAKNDKTAPFLKWWCSSPLREKYPEVFNSATFGIGCWWPTLVWKNSCVPNWAATKRSAVSHRIMQRMWLGQPLMYSYISMGQTNFEPFVNGSTVVWKPLNPLLKGTI